MSNHLVSFGNKPSSIISGNGSSSNIANSFQLNKFSWSGVSKKLNVSLFAIGETLLITANQGVSPWTVLAQGISFQTNLSIGFTTFIVSLIVLILWYPLKQKPGLGTILNIVLIFGFLSGLGAVLTLPGIAGIVLTIGMSVDANVLIFERVREELRREKGLKQAVSDGFSNALSSILDANITTGVTALVLFVFGTGPIKGFATTLLIGIMTSLFTAVSYTHLTLPTKA